MRKILCENRQLPDIRISSLVTTTCMRRKRLSKPTFPVPAPQFLQEFGGFRFVSAGQAANLTVSGVKTGWQQTWVRCRNFFLREGLPCCRNKNRPIPNFTHDFVLNEKIAGTYKCHRTYTVKQGVSRGHHCQNKNNSRAAEGATSF